MTASSNDPPSNDSGGPGGPGPSGEIPEGAIPIGEELYMVPAGIDREGCAQFTAWSATKAVLQVIYYRDRNGAFTTDRTKANCGKT